MTFEPLDDDLIRRAERSFGFPGASVPSTNFSTSFLDPSGLYLSEIPETPLTWLWPGRIPQGHLTLLDAAPGSDPSLFALTLAACFSRGNPLPDGTLTLPSNVILYAPYDSPSVLKPRLQAAGGDPDHLLLFRPPLANASHPTNRIPSFVLPRDLPHLASTIRSQYSKLVILDPASAISGLSRCLPALAELAQQTNCAIVLIRTLTRPSANPLHPSGPASPIQEAARSCLLLTPDPTDERHHLLITTRHPLCQQPPILVYDLLFPDQDIPRLRWLAERDRASLARLSTGPLYSPHRQAILRFLQNSVTPQSIPTILQATCYDPEAGRQMLTRMKQAGELISPARGLYTTANHPSLTSFQTTAPTPVSNVTTDSGIPSQGTSAGLPSLACSHPDSSIPNVTIPPGHPSQDTGGACPRPGSSISNITTDPDTPSLTVPDTSTPPPSLGSTQSNPPHDDIPPTTPIPIADQVANLIPTDPDLPSIPNAPNPPDNI